MEFNYNDLSKPTAVICVDIWDTFNKNYSLTRFLRNINHKIIICASYSNPVERYLGNTIWYRNRYKKFKNDVTWFSMHAASIESDTRRKYNRKTREDLLTYYNINQHLIGLYWTWELLYILDNYEEQINNICFIGGNWDECLIDRPLGWYKVGQCLPRLSYNIITFTPLLTKGFNTEINQIVSQTPNWCQITEEYFYYNNPNINHTSYLEIQKMEQREPYQTYSQNFDWSGYEKYPVS